MVARYSPPVINFFRQVPALRLGGDLQIRTPRDSNAANDLRFSIPLNHGYPYGFPPSARKLAKKWPRKKFQPQNSTSRIADLPLILNW